jgi:hypothetical protein
MSFIYGRCSEHRYIGQHALTHLHPTYPAPPLNAARLLGCCAVGSSRSSVWGRLGQLVASCARNYTGWAMQASAPACMQQCMNVAQRFERWRYTVCCLWLLGAGSSENDWHLQSKEEPECLQVTGTMNHIIKRSAGTSLSSC